MINTAEKREAPAREKPAKREAFSSTVYRCARFGCIAVSENPDGADRGQVVIFVPPVHEPIPVAMQEMFLCPAYLAKLTRWACGKRHEKANAVGADVGVTDRLRFCIGCEIGEKHAKSHVAPDVSIDRVVRFKEPAKPDIPPPPAPTVTTAKLYMYEGAERTVPEIAKLKGMDVSSLYVRIGRWGAERALREPYGGPSGIDARQRPAEENRPAPGPQGGKYMRAPRAKKTVVPKTYPYQGADRTIAEIASMMGIETESLRSRIKRMGPDKALNPEPKRVRIPKPVEDKTPKSLIPAPTYAFNDEQLTLGAIAQRLRLSTQALKVRIARYGYEKAVAMGPNLATRWREKLPKPELGPIEVTTKPKTGVELVKSAGRAAQDLLAAAGIEVYSVVEFSGGLALFIKEK